MVKKFILAAAMTVIATGANAAFVQTATPSSASVLFSAEVQFDQNLHSKGGKGHDIYLRAGENGKAKSKGFKFGGSGMTYDWSLQYDDGEAAFRMGKVSRDVDVAGGRTWNGLQFGLTALDNRLFETASVTVTVDSINGADVTGDRVLSITDGRLDATLASLDIVSFDNVFGTVTFGFDVKNGAKGSPAGNLGFVVGGVEGDFSQMVRISEDIAANNAAVPVPAGALLMAPVLMAAAFIARRKSRK